MRQRLRDSAMSGARVDRVGVLQPIGEVGNEGVFDRRGARCTPVNVVSDFDFELSPFEPIDHLQPGKPPVCFIGEDLLPPRLLHRELTFPVPGRNCESRRSVGTTTRPARSTSVMRSMPTLTAEPSTGKSFMVIGTTPEIPAIAWWRNSPPHWPTPYMGRRCDVSPTRSSAPMRTPLGSNVRPRGTSLGSDVRSTAR
jgi:hypothetical protein